MTLLHLTKEEIETTDDALLTLFSYSLKRLPSLDNEEGKKILKMVEEELDKRGVDKEAVLKAALPRILGE
jgi:hypothetical protein